MLFTRKPSIAPDEAAARLVRRELQLVDVRQPSELRRGSVRGSVNVPLSQLRGRLHELDPDRPIAFLCHSGARSSRATGIALKAGYDAVNVRGGLIAWNRCWAARGSLGSGPVPLAAIPFGLGIGLSLGMFGGGGSVLAVPVLVYVLGQTVHQATTASLVVVTVGAVIGGLSNARDGRVCWRHAAAFIAAALPGVIAGTALGQAVSGGALITAFAVIMLAAAAATWHKATRDATSPRTQVSPTSCPALRLARVLTAGLLVGATTGFFGVGGGFLIVPTLAVALAFSMRTAVGTSLVIITATSLMALSVHLAAGRTLDVDVTIAMTVSAIAGALAGVRLAERVPQRQLGQGFAALVVVVAAYLIISAALLGGPPGTS